MSIKSILEEEKNQLQAYTCGFSLRKSRSKIVLRLNRRILSAAHKKNAF